ncbi:outer membrane protein assembly factor BamD [Litorimonas cladophorae]|uniref:Outer membrane protein assembly factor BamD n=1 Tax=Litorimonas cladophorae TaxID=1220491 RepID=A0A918NEB4_9PROT|nr:outer membrane protein assembly factor BamD [Litorimonas cladophorae]GGX60864.1 outer membrane protein assembly factor BamD [Litorimonas cladophorae]
MSIVSRLPSTLRLTILGATLFAITGCGSLGGKKEKLAYVERPAELIYNQALEEMARSDWADAKLLFQEVERQHPFSKWARRSMLMSAYASYRSADHDESVAMAQRFVGLHPGSDSAPYAYYLVAMNYYDQIYDVGRDQATTIAAEAALQQVVRRYPDSDYARDARLKLELTQDHLAGKEMSIGRYYLRQNQHLAAIGRFKSVVSKYETTSQTEEALHRLVESYVSIGVIQEAKLVGSVLGYNYPNSEWYKDSYNLLQNYGVNLDDEINKPRKQGYWTRLKERLF